MGKPLLDSEYKYVFSKPLHVVYMIVGVFMYSLQLLTDFAYEARNTPTDEVSPVIVCTILSAGIAGLIVWLVGTQLSVKAEMWLASLYAAVGCIVFAILVQTLFL